MSPNERLRSALAATGHTPRSLAACAGTDPKTVERWINTGRVPHRSNAQRAAHALGEDPTYLWPQTATPRGNAALPHAELVSIYAQRCDVPWGLWRAMFNRAQHRIEVLVYAALFLHEQMGDWNTLLRAKARDGCHVRILIGDPSSAAVALRGAEERFGDGIESRCRLAARHYAPLLGTEGIQLARHSTTLYNSLYRADGELLANTHIVGANAFANPVFHLQRRHDDGLFDAYTASFESVWATADPIKE